MHWNHQSSPFVIYPEHCLLSLTVSLLIPCISQIQYCFNNFITIFQNNPWSSSSDWHSAWQIWFITLQYSFSWIPPKANSASWTSWSAFTFRNYPFYNLLFIFNSIILPLVTWHWWRKKFMIACFFFSTINWLSEKISLVFHEKNLLASKNPGGSFKKRRHWKNGVVDLTRSCAKKDRLIIRMTGMYRREH